tara:strand:- start:254 stop:625 length:372 start_codon:yes stop_codon:yes gene_type:complete
VNDFLIHTYEMFSASIFYGFSIFAILTIASIILVRFAQFSIARFIGNPNRRYRARKTIQFTGYLLVILLLILIFSNQLGQASVALGVAGAGIAFALQEVIASVALRMSFTTRSAGAFDPRDFV